ncbi:putative ribosome biogenesis GTPase RsgA [Bacteroidota bacterium]|nr:putative ribosome biogenesis GTPase RsgA [Bacteroidota bacterium]
MKGRVTKSTGSWYDVLTDEGVTLQCRLKGKLRLENRRTTNPVVIGDWVMVEPEKDNSAAVISEVLKRNNYIIRQSARNRTAEHILAANIDRAFIIATVKQPATTTGFIDRFLLTAEAYHIPSTILLNKMDLYNEDDLKQVEFLKNIYSKAGYPVELISAKTDEHLNAVRALMKDKVNLVAGHSGVGKSTFINKMIPGMNLKVGDVSDYHSKGMHTTTFAEMFHIPEGGFIIDTPGIKEFGILDLAPEELAHYFPEMKTRMHDCKFNNCLHINEPKCAIRDAVEKGEISKSRYGSYLAIVEDVRNTEKIYDKE